MIFAIIQRLIHARFTDLDDGPPPTLESPARRANPLAAR